MPSLILNLLIFWFIGSLIAGQRRRQQTARKTMTKTKKRPVRRVRRGLTGPPYQEEDEELEVTGSEIRTGAATMTSSQDEEFESKQSGTAAAVMDSWETLPREEPLDTKPATRSESLQVANTIVQSLILMQVLTEPRCKRAWRVR